MRRKHKVPHGCKMQILLPRVSLHWELVPVLLDFKFVVFADKFTGLLVESCDSFGGGLSCIIIISKKVSKRQNDRI